MVVGAFERGWAGFPLTSNLKLQLGELWLHDMVTKKPHSYFGLWPFQHHDRSLTLYKPSLTRSQHPQKRPVPGPCLCEIGPPGQAGSQVALKEMVEHRGPENRFNQKHSARVRGVFHRKRGGEPRASSTRCRACTGGQRQSYKWAGYLTKSSGPASLGPVGTATEPHSSSWRGQRCFLEGKRKGLRLPRHQAKTSPSPCSGYSGVPGKGT